MENLLRESLKGEKHSISKARIHDACEINKAQGREIHKEHEEYAKKMIHAKKLY